MCNLDVEWFGTLNMDPNLNSEGLDSNAQSSLVTSELEAVLIKQ